MNNSQYSLLPKQDANGKHYPKDIVNACFTITEQSVVNDYKK